MWMLLLIKGRQSHECTNVFNYIYSCIRGSVVFINHPAFRGTLEFPAISS
jgi:hypothetical protein